ncbi:MAG TPA: DUF3311 domain-containing protein [Stellaceae bacterium]|nr:DUF3311 domain-containing protein [Stellaceae bacterium]
MTQPPRDGRDWSRWHLLFVVLFVIALWVPFYNRIEPSLWGMPFFYWFQLAMIVVGAIVTAIVYFITEA